MGELLVQDYLCKGFIDGCVLCMLIILVCLGVFNKVVFSFVLGIICELFNGQFLVCLVMFDICMWLMLLCQVIVNLIYGYEINGVDLGLVCFFFIDGLCVIVKDMVEVLEQVVGKEVVQLIEWKEDEVIKCIVNFWFGVFEVKCVKVLGFMVDVNFVDIIWVYIEDEVKK